MQQALRHCESLVRAADKDRYVATLFAPAEHRPAIFTLYAFNAEIVRVRDAARVPIAGEIRLQWWSDVLASDDPRQTAGHPVAAALGATIAEYGLHKETLGALVDAHRFDLYDEPMQKQSEFERYAEATSANLIALCAQILDQSGAVHIGVLAHHAGIAQTTAGLLGAFAKHVQRGQLYFPLELFERQGLSRAELVSANPGRYAGVGLRAALAEARLIAADHLAMASDLLASTPPALLPAVLPVAVAPRLLARMEQVGDDPYADIGVPAWRRQWIIWRAARQPARIFR
jgi:phytoene synthase